MEFALRTPRDQFAIHNYCTYPLAGRDHYLGKHGTAESKAKWRRLTAEYLLSGVQAIRRPGKGCDALTVESLVDAYVSHQEAKHGDAKRKKNVGRVRCGLRV